MTRSFAELSIRFGSDGDWIQLHPQAPSPKIGDPGIPAPRTQPAVAVRDCHIITPDGVRRRLENS